MQTKQARITALLAMLVAFMAGCTSTTAVRVESEFPAALAEPRPVNAAIVFDEGFQTYVGRPTSRITIDFGKAQVDLLGKAFRGLFENVELVTSRDQVGPTAELVITPSVLEVQVSTPSDSYLNVYEVWIKYNLDIETVGGDPIDSWFMPAYGKTPDSFMLSREEAIEEAAIVAIRDAGAKLLLDFYRIPAVAGWMQQEQKF